jgi:hypothetical protein
VSAAAVLSCALLQSRLVVAWLCHQDSLQQQLLLCAWSADPLGACWMPTVVHIRHHQFALPLHVPCPVSMSDCLPPLFCPFCCGPACRAWGGSAS